MASFNCSDQRHPDLAVDHDRFYVSTNYSDWLVTPQVVPKQLNPSPNPKKMYENLSPAPSSIPGFRPLLL